MNDRQPYTERMPEQGTGFYGIYDRETNEPVEEVFWRSPEKAQEYLDSLIGGLDTMSGVPFAGEVYGPMHDAAVAHLYVAEVPRAVVVFEGKG